MPFLFFASFVLSVFLLLPFLSLGGNLSVEMEKIKAKMKFIFAIKRNLLFYWPTEKEDFSFVLVLVRTHMCVSSFFLFRTHVNMYLKMANKFIVAPLWKIYASGAIELQMRWMKEKISLLWTDSKIKFSLIKQVIFYNIFCSRKFFSILFLFRVFSAKITVTYEADERSDQCLGSIVFGINSLVR